MPSEAPVDPGVGAAEPKGGEVDRELVVELATFPHGSPPPAALESNNAK